MILCPIHESNDCHTPAGTPAGGQFCGAGEKTWHNQQVNVLGQPRRLGDVAGGKLYHASPVVLQVGDTLEPGHGRNFKQSAANMVSLTSDAGRARHWGKEAAKGERLHVYEVEPLGLVEAHRAGLTDYGKSFILWEGRVSRARIVGVIE